MSTTTTVLCVNLTSDLKCPKRGWNSSVWISCAEDVFNATTNTTISCQGNSTNSNPCLNNSIVADEEPDLLSRCNDSVVLGNRTKFVPEFRVRAFSFSVVTILVSLWLLIQICRCPHLHTTVNKFVASLCVCGCLNGVLGLVFVWPYDIRHAHQVCLVYICAYCATFVVIFVHFMVISLERYLHIVHPFVHIRLTTTNRPTALCLATTWTFSFVIAFSPLYVTLKPGWTNACLEMALVIPFWLFVLTYVGILLTSTTIAGIAYFSIFRVALRHTNAINQNRNIPWAAGNESHTIENIACSFHGVDVPGNSINVQQIPERVDHPRGNNASLSQAAADADAALQRADGKGSPGDVPETAEHGNRGVAQRRASERKTASKLRSAIPFVVLYVYYVMSWAPNTAIKTYMAYTNKLSTSSSLNYAADILTLFCPIGYCLLYMYLEKEVRRVTLDKLLGFARRRRSIVDVHPLTSSHVM